MSSPITAKKKGPLDAALIRVHRSLSHSRRVAVLASAIAERIAGQFRGNGPIRCLDVGCGDMGIAETIGEIEPRTTWTCLDVYELPGELRGDPHWEKYRTFDGRTIPLPDRSEDVVIFCDVLHHAGGDAPLVLAEAGRVGRTVIIKDHFEYSVFSRAVLWAMDFVGNWGYGVPLPRRYFTPDSFSELAARTGLRVTRMDAGIDLYAHLPLAGRLLRRKWQFIAVLEPLTR